MISDMYHVCRNEGFDDIKIHHIGGLWVWIQFNSEKSRAAFTSNESLNKLWITSQEVSPSFVVDERMIWIKIYGLPLYAWGSNEDVSFSMDQVKDNHIVTHKDMAGDEVVSDNTKPPGFENFIKENKACSWSSSTSRAGKCSTSFANYSSKDLKGFSFIDEMNQMIEVGGALSYDVKGYHIERVILFGDLNEVRSESERFGSTFSYGDATIFNSFIHDTGLINLPMGGRYFTWVNDESKMSKLDRFLISDDVLHSNTYLKFDRIDFEDFVKEKWVAISDLEQSKPLHTKLKDLKSHLKLWYAHTKEVEANRKNCILATLRDMDKKIDDGHATDVDRTTRINKMQELEDLEKLELMDLVQKSRVKWEVEGDENSKFFRGLINSRRNSQIVQGIMLDGVWNSEAKDIKSAFLDFYKDNFSCHDSLVSFPPMLPLIVLALLIRIFSNPWSLWMKLRWRFGIVIVAKILANRLSKIINSIISLEQFAFMTWRQILDGPLILSETIDWYKKRKKKMMLFKVDFEKAFDYVSWRYPDYVVNKLGFGIKWRNWIKAGLASARTSILINESPTSEFS
ncbi:RNA-directed DNA polymerase, eukaryota, reverse transcriptase zinc-binding domain protein [Tanacetum coccineum]